MCLHILWFLILLPLIGDVSAGLQEYILVDVQWLKQHLYDKKFNIVDVRTEEEYRKGHIPGAVNIPVASTNNRVGATDRIGHLQQIQKVFSRAGIRQDNTVVIYDDSKYVDAGRVFWVFEVYGHKQVKLLNGGFPGWSIKGGLPVSKTAPIVQASEYVPLVDPDRLITRLSMRLAIDEMDKYIIDARPAEEYEGVRSRFKRFGHIPTAISIPAQKNFIEVDGIRMLKPYSDLKKLYADAEGKKVYTYCNEGKDSSLTYAIIRHLGHDAAHYDGSWHEWGNDPEATIK